MTIHTHLKEMCRRHPISRLIASLGIARPTIHSWMTSGVSARLPSPRHLQALLDVVDATPEQRAEAWRLLAEADEERARRTGDMRAAA